MNMGDSNYEQISLHMYMQNVQCKLQIKYTEEIPTSVGILDMVSAGEDAKD
jgi:hypothetical protein